MSGEVTDLAESPLPNSDRPEFPAESVFLLFNALSADPDDPLGDELVIVAFMDRLSARFTMGNRFFWHDEIRHGDG